MEEPRGVHAGERFIDHATLRQRTAQTASALAGLGVARGDRVAIVLRNDPAFLEVSGAAALLGAVPVPVNWHWRGEELRHLLTDSGSRVVVVHTDLLPTVEQAAPAGVAVVEAAVPPELSEAYGLPEAAREPTGRHLVLHELVESHGAWELPPTAPPLSLIYTSGTTGRPKGIARTPPAPETAKRMVGSVVRLLGLEPGMRTLIPAPLYHTAPNVHALFSVALGLDLHLLPRFDAEDLLRLVARERIEHVQVVPTMLHRLLQLPPEVRERYDVSSLRVVVHAAAPCPQHVKRAAIDWLGPVLLEYYGGSETGIVTWCDTEAWLAHPGTVGSAVDDAGVRIHAPDGTLLGPGQDGEVYLRPPSWWPQFTYLGDDDRRRRIERDGHVTIGDVGHLDEDGYLHLTDRSTDLVISGGVNISPAEVEAVLLALPGVRDAAVFGIPDDDLGEVLAAHVEADSSAHLTEDDVRRHVGSHLAGYKVPRQVAFDDSLPREDSGKLFKRRLRERYVRSTL